MLDGGSAKVYGTGANVRDWIHVDDHNDAVIRIIEDGRAGETYLVGADGEKSNLEIVAMLNELFGRKDSDIEFVSDRPGHDLRYAIDSSKLRSELGWIPKHNSIREGLEETVRWYSDNRDWWQPSKDATERMYKGMGK
jgi:dTDP-glucose 4,6-dehydratase